MNSFRSNPEARKERLELAINEIQKSRQQGESLDQAKWLERYSDIKEELLDFFQSSLAEPPLEAEAIPSSSNRFSTGIDVEATVEFTDLNPPSGNDRVASPSAPSIVGDYRLIRLLGSGGMGHVYEAMDSFGHRVAIKLLSPKLACSEEAIERFRQEGAIASSINHPRCVFVKAADADQGTPYIAMELMTGRTLRDLIVDQKGLPSQVAVAKILDVIEGLQEAHERGMIHRDIKPANCYLEPDGRVKLGDFGLARSLIEDSELTNPGHFVGTPLFASPEQIRGEELDPRSDVYSLCATLYYLLTGAAPFANSSALQVVAKIVSEDPLPLRAKNPGVPAGLEFVVLKGLNRNKAARYQSAEELKRALLPFLTPQRAIVGIGRRFGAWVVDSVVITGLTIPFGFLVAEEIKETETINNVFAMLIAYIGCLYYFATEAIWGTTLGKKSLGLQVVHQDIEHKPSWLQCFARSHLYYLTFGSAVDILGYFFDSWFSFFWMTVVQGFASTLSILVSLLPVFLTKQRRMLHEILSGTKVVDCVKQERPLHAALEAAEWKPELREAIGFPASIGPYTVRGLMASCGENTVLLAEDEKLSRATWLLIRPLSSPKISDARKACDRISRARWLSCGQEEAWQWDAFVAPTGAPLSHWSKPGDAYPWSVARQALKQLLDEEILSQKEDTFVDAQTMEQVWLDERGRLTLIDSDWLPVTASPALTPPKKRRKQPEVPRDPVVASSLALLRETARQLLEGESQPLKGPVHEVPSIVPLSARQVLEKLDGTQPPCQSLEEIRAGLEATKSSEDTATLQARMTGLAISVMTLGFLFLYLFALSRMVNLIGFTTLHRSLAHNTGLAWLGEHPNDLKELMEANPDLREPWTPEFIQQTARKNHERLLEGLQQRMKNQLWFERSMTSAMNLDQKLGEELDWSDVERSSGEEFGLLIPGWISERMSETITAKRLRELVDRRDEPQALSADVTGWLIAATSIPFWIVVVWSGFCYGGIPLLASRLHIVRSNGRLAPWWLRMVRSTLVWLPIASLLMLVMWLDMYYPSQGWLIRPLARLLILTPLIYAVLICLTPSRAPQDRLLGTYLVPS